MAFDLGSFSMAAKAGREGDDNVGLDKLVTKLAEISADYVMGLDATVDATFLGDILVGGTVDGVDIATRDAILTTTNGWGNHASAGYGTSNLALGTTSSDALQGDSNIKLYDSLGVLQATMMNQYLKFTSSTASAGKVTITGTGTALDPFVVDVISPDTIYTHPTGAGNEHLPSTVSQTEAGYLDGVTSAIQTQLDAKQAEADALVLGISSTTALRGDTPVPVDLTVASAGTVHTTNYTDTNTQLPLIDSDTMSGASATNVASAESVKAYVDGKFNLMYLHLHGQGIQSSDDIWYFPKDTGGVEYYKWEDATDSVSVADTEFTLPRASQHKGIVMPYDCWLVGFIGASSASGNSQGAFSLWEFQPHWGEGGSGGTTATRTHYGEADLTIEEEGEETWEVTTNYTSRPAKVVAHGGEEEGLDAPVWLTAGTAIIPAATDTVAEGGSNTQRITMTIILKVPII